MLGFAQIAVHTGAPTVYAARMDRARDPTNGQTADHTADQTAGPITVTVADAAKLLGLSAEAVRMRVKRGTLASTKAAGTVYVLLEQPNGRSNDEPNGRPNARPNDQTNAGTDGHEALIRNQQDQIEYLRRELGVRNEELRRKDHLLAAALERIPELAAPQGPRDGRRGSGRG